MRKKSYQKNLYYFPEKLKRQLALIPYSPVTIVEAPSGFGKTTAIREFLKSIGAEEVREYWYTCFGEPTAAAWHSICELIANVNEKAAARLEGLGVPTINNLMSIAGILRGSECLQETYLVIDNYQLVHCGIHRELISAFSMHGGSSLHIIFITQQLKSRTQITFNNSNLHTIGANAFNFDKDCINRLFQVEGLLLSEEELDTVYRNTEGWVSAVRLQILNYIETGAFHRNVRMERLVEIAAWSRLSPMEQDFLVSVSIMDGFTARQAAIMIGEELLPEYIKLLLDSNDFIRYYPDKHIYTIHSILRDYLRSQFYNHRPVSFQKRILHLAGQSYAANSQLLAAAHCFLKIKDYDAVMSLPFDLIYLANQKENKLVEFLLALLEECPEKILCQYPFVMLLFAYVLLFDRQMEAFQQLSTLITCVIDSHTLMLNSRDLQRLKGEYILLLSFQEYGNLNKRYTGIKSALKILGGPSSIIVKDMPWAFGGISVLCKFWRNVGDLEETLRIMDEDFPDYLKVSRGHGTGADSALRAEALLMRGKDYSAEILCYKAIYEARNKQQISICICAELSLARIAILRGDIERYNSAVENIRGYAKEDANHYILRMAELSQAALDITLGIRDRIPDWMKKLESISQVVYIPAVPYVQIIFSYILMKERRYSELYAAANLIMKNTGKESHLLTQVYQMIILAVAYYNSGNNTEAVKYLKQALALAVPDKIYLPFAQLWMEYSALLESVFEPEYQSLRALCKKHARGVNIIKKALLKTKTPLTPREREIAQFAKARLSTREIAGKLFISENTVRTTLRNIYFKLEIHSKSELGTKEF